jgi:hypothetical protein
VALAPSFAVQAQLTNATISGNSGGGLAYRPDFGSSQNRLTNVTIAGNTGGPGVSTIAGSPPLRLKNALVANHAGGNCSGPLTSEGSNLSSDTKRYELRYVVQPGGRPEQRESAARVAR